MTPNEETEFWREYRASQIARREKREKDFNAALPEFKAAVKAMGLTLHSPGPYHYQIKRRGKLIANYWPRPHHKYQICGEPECKSARNARDFLDKMKKLAVAGRRAG